MKVLVFAPHPDDEVIGCAGTLSRYIDHGADVYICYMTSGYPPVFDNSLAVQNGWPHNLYPEIVNSRDALGVKEIFFLKFPVCSLEHVPRCELTGAVQKLVCDLEPDVVFIPHFGDMQKDHAITAETVMVAVRPKLKHNVSLVYAYETLSETEWNIPHASFAFVPNVYVDIGAYMDRKLAAMRCYRSQVGAFPNPRSIEAIEALAKYRGSTMGAMAAEAFMLVREYRRDG